ncbi:MAG: hypothetical protein CW691_06050 [Candidatus Bathyarchaeum sp.]|nr:MAG: hypothetical protein CW691_06050 [Candidatus Bathyarchaeum sp.]
MSLKRWLRSGRGWLFLVAILIFSMFTVGIYFATTPETEAETSSVEPYFGVSFCGDTTNQAKLLIDKTKDCTNLFVLQSGPVSKNETATNIICDYAVDAGLDVIVFFGWFDPDCPWQLPWLTYAKERWGASFLGVYLYDEPGGIQIDGNWSSVFHRVKEYWPEFYQEMSSYIEEYENQTVLRDYDEAAKRYVSYVVGHIQLEELFSRSITSFTSDYALYWFDYLAGYDTVFVELGWEHDSQKHIALCRGAATAQQKDWGTIIVWNSLNRDNPKEGDYKSGAEMLEDMCVSYEAGADYIIIFNYPTNPAGNPYGILTDEHFSAMQEFWSYMEENPEGYGKTQGQVALVLPENYGWGMRSLDDRIWGYWGPDEYSEQIWELTQSLLDQHGLGLDIVYDDPDYPITDIYEKVVYWNSTD